MLALVPASSVVVKPLTPNNAMLVALSGSAVPFGQPVLVRTQTKNRRNSRRSPAIRRRTRKTDEKKVRRGKRKHQQSRQANFLCLDRDRGGVPFKVRQMPANRPSVLGVNVLTSKAWIKTPPPVRVPVSIPYIDRWGKFTGAACYTSVQTPQGFMSIVISTLFRRLKFWTLRKNSLGEFNKRQAILLKACGYYALTKNDWFWNRILALTRVSLCDRWRTIKSLLHSVSHKLDAHTWFVYGHVCLQTQWLTSRALRPRDKSAFSKSEDNFTIPAQLLGKGDEIGRFAYTAVWSCFSNMHTL